METILVTGCAGFIGSHVCERLLAKGYTVVGIDNFNDYYDHKTKEKNIETLNKNKAFILYRVDILDFQLLKEIFEKHPCSRIIHLAARAGVRPSIADPTLYAEVNINGTLNLLELAKQHKVKGFIFASSSSVYGLNTKVPFSEEDDVSKQISPYGVSKRAGELYCYTYHKLYGIPITCLRFFTVYGPRGRPDMAPYLFTEKIYKGEPIDMYGDGSSERDYTFITDIVEGIITALEKNYSFEIVNLGNSNPIALKKFIAIIEKKLGKKAKTVQKPMQEGDMPRTFADLQKAERLLQFKPKIGIEEGMGKFIDWYCQEKAKE